MIVDGKAKASALYLEWARKHFDRCRPWIEEALERQPIPSHTIDHVWEAIESGNCVIWPTDNSVSIVEFVTHPTGIRTLNGWLSGGDLKELKRTEKIVTKFAEDNGFYALTILGRDGWGRALEGYSKGVKLYVKELRHGSKSATPGDDAADDGRPDGQPDAAIHLQRGPKDPRAPVSEPAGLHSRV